MFRKKTIFDDKPVEIQELTFIIKEDIANLNKQIAQLQQVNLYDIRFIDLLIHLIFYSLIRLFV